MVEHNLSVVANLSDTHHRADARQVLAEGDYADGVEGSRVVEAYLGAGHA
jgi:branched-chain amino acid transport system ATP-binding protein